MYCMRNVVITALTTLSHYMLLLIKYLWSPFRRLLKINPYSIFMYCILQLFSILGIYFLAMI